MLAELAGNGGEQHQAHHGDRTHGCELRESIFSNLSRCRRDDPPDEFLAFDFRQHTQLPGHTLSFGSESDQMRLSEVPFIGCRFHDRIDIHVNGRQGDRARGGGAGRGWLG